VKNSTAKIEISTRIVSNVAADHSSVASDGNSALQQAGHEMASWALKHPADVANRLGTVLASTSAEEGGRFAAEIARHLDDGALRVLAQTPTPPPPRNPGQGHAGR